MGEVVQLRDYQRKDQPLIIDGRELLNQPIAVPNDERVIYCSPPIKDTAPSEFCAPEDGDCA